MAADSGRPGLRLAALVCSTCKYRKKKCDKVLPSCGSCVRKGLNCVYETRPRNDAPSSLDHTSHASPVASSPSASPQAILLEPGATQANLYRRVLHLIRETGQFVDDISARYFQGIHRYLPVCSRTRFHRSLITLGAVPSAGFSALLLSICLATSSSRATNTRPFDRRSLYLATRSFLAQVQGSFRPDIHLVQARLLLAVYEYNCGRPDDAFDSIAGCARMAYAARLHLYNRSSLQLPGFREVVTNVNTDADTDLQLETKEAANTWWGITICERVFFCEVTTPEQPLVTIIPDGNALLPTEPAVLEQTDYLSSNLIPHVAVSSISSIDVGGFGRSAQAVWLLDQVLNGFKIQSLDSKLSQLKALDSTFQKFLGGLVHQGGGKGSVFCEAIAITIRALFALHSHVTSLPQNFVQSTTPLLEDWSSRSDAALNTVTKMVVDVVDAHDTFDLLAPSYAFMVRAALRHIHEKTYWKDDSWLLSAEERLQTSLEKFDRHWNVESY